MKKYWKYLQYVLKHKLFVYQEGRKLEVSRFQLLIHDASKFSWVEFKAYTDYFYGENVSPKVCEAFDAAWLHHQHRNPHHWQHWILRADSGNTTVLKMPEKYVREMVADWAGAGRAITGKLEVRAWFAQNFHKMTFHSETSELVVQLLEKYYKP